MRPTFLRIYHTWQLLLSKHMPILCTHGGATKGGQHSASLQDLLPPGDAGCYLHTLCDTVRFDLLAFTADRHHQARVQRAHMCLSP
jgi:hypothetical protein